jgi:hypothetical protein
VGPKDGWASRSGGEGGAESVARLSITDVAGMVGRGWERRKSTNGGSQNAATGGNDDWRDGELGRMGKDVRER